MWYFSLISPMQFNALRGKYFRGVKFWLIATDEINYDIIKMPGKAYFTGELCSTHQNFTPPKSSHIAIAIHAW